MKPFFSFLTIQKPGGEPHSRERLPVHLLLACLLLLAPMTTMAQDLQDCYDSYDSTFAEYISLEASNTLAICSSGGGGFRIEREGLDSAEDPISFSASAGANSCTIVGDFGPGTVFGGTLTKPEFREWKRFLRSECSEVTQPSERIVFVTSGTYSGDLLAEASALKGKPFKGESGLGAGDHICQYHAKKGGLPGSYTAWLSDGSTSARQRTTDSEVPYYLIDGTKVADSRAAMIDGVSDGDVVLDAPISIDENGSDHSDEDGNVWTGTLLDGTASAKNCLGWTSSALEGLVGTTYSGLVNSNGIFIPTGATTRWTQRNSQQCNTLRRLYCFQD